MMIWDSAELVLFGAKLGGYGHQAAAQLGTYLQKYRQVVEYGHFQN